MARAFGSYHDHVDFFRWSDGFEVNRKAVGEQQGLAFGEVLLDVLGVNRRNNGVGSGDENHVSSFHRIGGFHDLEAELLSNFPGFGFFVETNDDLQATVFQVQCVSMSL